MGKCTAKTKAGKACKSAALTGSSRCLFHSKPKSVGYVKSRKMSKKQARK